MTRYVDAFRVSLWYDVTAQTVCRWSREGRFPNAIRIRGRHRPWRIPYSDLKSFEPPKRGGDMRSGRLAGRGPRITHCIPPIIGKDHKYDSHR